MPETCPACKKEFVVLWPQKWAYRRGKQLICSWKCLRALEAQKEETKGETRGMRAKVPEDVKERAILAAIDGGDPLKVLAPCTKDPQSMWKNIKAKLKASDPDRYELIPDRRMKKAEPAAETLPAGLPEPNCDIEYDHETQRVRVVPLKDDGMEYNVMGIRTEMGIFQYYRHSDYLDWTPDDISDTVSLNTDEWRQLLEDLPKIMKILGGKA